MMISDDQRKELEELFKQKQNYETTITLMKDKYKALDRSIISQALDAVLSPDTKPIDGCEALPAGESNEVPKYLLKLDSVNFQLIVKNEVKVRKGEEDPIYDIDKSISHVSGKDHLGVLYEGGCSCRATNKCQNTLNFIILGRSGHGKSTLINSFINYLLGVKVFDKFRYTVVEGESGVQTESQTQHIVMYHIPQSMIKNKINGISCGINLIDTPGYGDTEGLEKDEKTKRMLHHLFKSFEHLDYLIIVSKSSETRMDAFAANVFSEMSQLYAKNVNERILALLTFSDFNLKATNTLA